MYEPFAGFESVKRTDLFLPNSESSHQYFSQIIESLKLRPS